MTAPDPTATLAALDFTPHCTGTLGAQPCPHDATCVGRRVHADGTLCWATLACDIHRDAASASNLRVRLCPHECMTFWHWDPIGGTT